MRIVIIGTGNVATVLGRMMAAAHHTVVQVYGRDAAKAAALAQEWQCTYTSSLPAVDAMADVYLVAVADAAIAAIAAELRVPGKLVLHTAGSVSREVLKPCSDRYGVLYPLQSIRQEMPALPIIPFLVDAVQQEDVNGLQQLALSLSSQVQVAGDEKRLTLHVAAVVVSNFTNHLYALAAQYCREEQADFNLLHPLIAEVATRLQYLQPGQSQTGPAVRGDQSTINRHLQLLEGHPALKQVYALMSQSIERLHRP